MGQNAMGKRISTPLYGLKVTAPGPALNPSLALGVTVTKNNTAHLYGAYSEIITATAADQYALGFVVDSANTGAALTYHQFRFATGATGSEVPFGEERVGGSSSYTGAAQTFGLSQTRIMFPYPVLIPAGTRIAAQYASGQSGSSGVLLSMIVINKANLVAL